MNVTVRKVGNSQAVIIPKSILVQMGLPNNLSLTFEQNKIILSPLKKVREDWEEDAKRIVALGDDKLLIPSVFDDENFDDWTW